MSGLWFWLLPSILTLFMMDDFTLWYKKHGCHCHVLTWLDKPWSYQPVWSHHPFPFDVSKQDKTRQKLKNKNILIFSSTQLGSGTCSRINSWGSRSKNLKVDIAILWIGLGKDQFWRKRGALGGDRMADKTAAVFGLPFPEILCSQCVPRDCWGCGSAGFSVSAIQYLQKRPKRGGSYSDFSEGSVHGLMSPHACAECHDDRDIWQRRFLTMSEGKLRKSSLYPFPFVFCLSSRAMPTVCPQSGCMVLTQPCPQSAHNQGVWSSFSYWSSNTSWVHPYVFPMWF